MDQPPTHDHDGLAADRRIKNQALVALLEMARLSVWVPLLAGCAQKSQRRPLSAELGSNLRTILRTNVGFQEKTAPSKSLKTAGVTVNAP